MILDEDLRIEVAISIPLESRRSKAQIDEEILDRSYIRAIVISREDLSIEALRLEKSISISEKAGMIWLV